MVPRYIRPIFILAMGILAIFLEPARAQWQPGGVVLSAAPNDQTQPVATADGLGGAIIAWYDTRNGTTSMYARKVDRYGVPQWTTDGVAICTATNIQDLPQIVSDAAGGAIITWEDKRTGVFDIYAQRVNALGVVQWTPNGVAVCTATNSQETPQILADGAGGAFIVWADLRPGSHYDIYGARVTSAGNVLWGTNGAAICTAAGHQVHPALMSDGVGGIFVAWEDNRGVSTDIYLQEVNAAGLGVWNANGIVVCSAFGGPKNFPQLVTDGAGGVIVGWTDYRNYPPSVYAQRVTSVGVPWWTTDGVEVTDINIWVTGPCLVADGQGGVIVVYQQQFDPVGYPFDLFAQRINAAGVRLWYQIGVQVSDADGSQYLARAVSDGAGGVIVAWVDDRMILDDLYVQRIDPSGNFLWQNDGVSLTSGYGERQSLSLVNDGMGGSIAAWYHNPSAVGTDIEAQRIDNAFGYWGHSEPVITSIADVPADQGGKVKVNWRASDQDRQGTRTITHYSVWRAVDPAAVAASSVVDGPAAVGAHFHGMATFREETPTTDYYWEWVGNQDAIFDKAYSFAAATRADSVAGNLSVHQFRVVAHTADAFVLFKSLPAFGYSVDNLAPAAPLLLTAQRVGSDVQLRWNRVKVPDLRDYSLYRATSSGVTPVPINFLESAGDTLAVDANAPSSALYYIVTALDVHANQSAPSNEAHVSPLTGIGDAPAITALTVLQNHPNPFTAATDFEIGLPAASDVSVDVFDVAGRRVSSIDARGLGAGWRRVPFAGVDRNGQSLASGVYFYRVTATGSTVTRKMVIAR